MEITNGNQHHDQPSFNGVGGGGRGGGGGGNYSNSIGNSGSGSGLGAVVNHDPLNWTPEEIAILEEGLYKYASASSLTRYARIARRLPQKTIRDVALRTRWMNKKDIGKRRKEDQSKKNRDRRENETDPSPKSTPDVGPEAFLDNDDDIPYKAIGGPTGELLEQNAQFFRSISANFNSLQIEDNISLFSQARDNLTKIMNSTKETPEIMGQLPPLTLELNEDLVSTILPSNEPSNTH